MSDLSIRADALSAEDFEAFAVKLCAIIFDKPNLCGVSRGTDGGIDGIDDNSNPTIVVQAKRWSPYRQSNYAKVEEEVIKIHKTAEKFGWSNPYRYVFVTSTGLSPETKNRILKEHEDIIPDDRSLIDSACINSFISNPSVKELYREYGLIDKDLASIFKADRLNCLDSDYQKFDPSYFVETSFLSKAYSILNEKHILIVHGNPGVGKTTLCKMLGYIFANLPAGDQDAKTRVLWRTTDQAIDVAQTFDSLFKNTANRLLVVFDDFLGSNFLNKESNDIKKLETLLSRVSVNTNLFVILNSRTHIFQSARRQFADIAASLDSVYKQSIEMLDMSEYSRTDKAKLLRMTLKRAYAAVCPEEKNNFCERYNLLRQDYKPSPLSPTQKQYYRIIEHHNYNPRLIEFIANNFLSSDDTLDAIVRTLDDPELIYEAPFSGLSKDEQWILYCLFTFKTQTVRQDILKVAVASLKEPEFDVIQGLKRLEGSWIRIEREPTGEFAVGFANPGIGDFLCQKNESVDFVSTIVKKTNLLCQIQKVQKPDEFYRTLLDRWDAFEDREQYVGEQTVAYLLHGAEKAKAIELLSRALSSYAGEWHLDSSNGWAQIFQAIEHGSFDVMSEFFNSLITDEDQPLRNRILSSDMAMSEFDSIVDFLIPQIVIAGDIDITAQPYNSIARTSRVFTLIDAIFKGKKEHIQRELDDSANYDVSVIVDELSSGMSCDDVAQHILEEIIQYNSDEDIQLYEDIDDYDISDIQSYVEDVEAQGEWDETYHDSPSAYQGKDEEAEINQILDKPISD